MEEMRAAAKAYYAHMSDDQHESFQSFYGLMDASGDGKVSRQEYNAFIRKQGYNYVPLNLFELLDKNNTGYLDYEECITFFYMVTCNRFVFCNECGSYLVGLHFSCVECYGVGKETYNLCCSCYQDNDYKHGHSYFLDSYDLLRTKPWKVNASGGGGGSLYKRAMMGDLVKTARLYYNKSSWDVKTSAHDFFNSLDNDNDGKVSLHEFLGCMRELGHVKMGSSQVFKELDKDMNGTLDFMEVMALYYIIKSGRPFCCGCDEFIPGMYFVCSVCFENGNNLYCVCPDCFQAGKFVHEHPHSFLDNFALLEAKRMQGTATYWNQPNSSVTIAEPPTSTINAVVPYQNPPPQRWNSKVLEMIFNAALNASFGAAFTSAFGMAAQSGFCTIM